MVDACAPYRSDPRVGTIRSACDRCASIRPNVGLARAVQRAGGMLLTVLFVVTGIVGAIVLSIEIAGILRRRRRRAGSHHEDRDGRRD